MSSCRPPRADLPRGTKNFQRAEVEAEGAPDQPGEDAGVPLAHTLDAKKLQSAEGRSRQLHRYGLLDAAFRPPAAILPLRAYTRHRKMLIEYAADHIRHIQKALDLMNVKLHLVVSDTVGVTGMHIIEGILDGQHSPASSLSYAIAGARPPPPLFSWPGALERHFAFRTWPGGPRRSRRFSFDTS